MKCPFCHRMCRFNTQSSQCRWPNNCRIRHHLSNGQLPKR